MTGPNPQTPTEHHGDDDNKKLPSVLQNCMAIVRGRLWEDTGVEPEYVGLHHGDGYDAEGRKGGTHNFDFRMGSRVNPRTLAPDGRFDDGLHVPHSVRVDGGFLVTAHVDPANPYRDLVSLLRHAILDVWLNIETGC